MARLTLRLPDTLHARLTDQAEEEGVSLNQHIVYALSQQSTMTYETRVHPTQAVAERQMVYEAIPPEGVGARFGVPTPPVLIASQPESVVNPEQFLRRTQKLRDLTAAHPLTDDLLEAAIAAGRP